MAKSLTLANGSILVGIDRFGHVRDFYYPRIGLQNQVSGASGTYTHRIGVWVDGTLAWLDDPRFKVLVSIEPGTPHSIIRATNDALHISLEISDSVYNEKNIFLRRVTLLDTSLVPRTVKLYFGQQFRIAEDRSGSTGFYDPRVHAVIHYKGHSHFLVNAVSNGLGFDDYSVGLFDMESHNGTHIDAEDGALSKNAIEHGSVDSVIGFSFSTKPRKKIVVDYWIAVGHDVHDAHSLNTYVLLKGPEHLHRTSKNYWRAWLKQGDVEASSVLGPDLIRLYEQSLLIIRAHMDRDGGVIASSDSDILNYGRDTYSYVWPRDAAFAAHALDQAGYPDASRKFFSFATGIIEPDGYFMHKYRTDGALGSSWHPWMWNGKPELPIQEDETASVIFMLYKHFERARDLEFVESIYTTLVAPAADFMTQRIDLSTKLPMESYDLWEEVFGTSTYTSSSVYGGLTAAAEFARLLGKQKSESRYRMAALRMREGILKHLYDAERGIFLKYIRRTEKGFRRDATVDASSLHGLLFFGVLPADDERIGRMVSAVEELLLVKSGVGGYMRYDGDRYYRLSEQDSPNPWIVTTLWVAQYRIAKATTRDELDSALKLIKWVSLRALPTSVLPEQVHPYNGTPLSATPLTWSHAEYVVTIREYLKKWKVLG